MASNTARRPVHAVSVAARVYGSDAVVITPAENIVRMFNPVGSRIWQLVDGTRTVQDIATVLTQEYDVSFADAEVSTQNFVSELIDLKLLMWTE